MGEASLLELSTLLAAVPIIENGLFANGNRGNAGALLPIEFRFNKPARLASLENGKVFYSILILALRITFAQRTCSDAIYF